MRRVGAVLTVALFACAPAAPEAPRRQIMPDLTGRPICGWDELMGQPPDVTLDPDKGATLPAGARVVSLSIADDVSYGGLRQALAPAEDTLVRLKLVLEDRWLLPVTIPAKVQPPKPKPGDAVETTVGYRRITRDKKAERERFADMRVDGDRVELYVENEAPGGAALALDELVANLRAQQPPIGVVALTASDTTSWAQLSRAIIAAACFDKQPGDEPHEVLLD